MQVPAEPIGGSTWRPGAEQAAEACVSLTDPHQRAIQVQTGNQGLVCRVIGFSAFYDRSEESNNVTVRWEHSQSGRERHPPEVLQPELVFPSIPAPSQRVGMKMWSRRIRNSSSIRSLEHRWWKSSARIWSLFPRKSYFYSAAFAQKCSSLPVHCYCFLMDAVWKPHLLFVNNIFF